MEPGGQVHPAVGPGAAAAARDAEAAAPPELIQAILRAPVDLLFAGGVGTVRPRVTEADETIDDRANSEIRVDASTVRARVVCEGANLALTQRARVELARRARRPRQPRRHRQLRRGRHLRPRGQPQGPARPALASGQLSQDARDALLTAATDDVVAAVLAGTAVQCEALRRAQPHSGRRPTPMRTCSPPWPPTGCSTATATRCPPDAARGRAEPAPGSPDPSSPCCTPARSCSCGPLSRPRLWSTRPALPSRSSRTCPPPSGFGPGPVDAHPLRRELTASVVVNDVVDQLGATCVHRLATSSGAPSDTVVTALWAARRVLRRTPLRSRFDDHDGQGTPTEPGHVDGETWMSASPTGRRGHAGRRGAGRVACTQLPRPGHRHRPRSVHRRSHRAGRGSQALSRTTAPSRSGVAPGPSAQRRRPAVRRGGHLAIREDLDIVPDVSRCCPPDVAPREVLRAFRRATEVLDLDGLERQLDLAPLIGRGPSRSAAACSTTWSGSAPRSWSRPWGGTRCGGGHRGRPLARRPRSTAGRGLPPPPRGRRRPAAGLEGVAVVVRALRRALDR